MQESMDLTDYGSEDDLKGYDYPTEGQYHLVCSEVDSSRQKSQAVYLTFTVLEGTAPGQVNKTFTERLGDPDFGQKDGGKFCRKRQAAMLLALGILTPDQLGKPNVSYNWEDAQWKQIKASVRNYKREGSDDNKGKEYRGAEIDGLNFWGPLDPAAQHIPHDSEAIAMARDGGQSNVVRYTGAGGQQAGGQANGGNGHTGQPSQPTQRQPTQPVKNDPYANL